MNILGGKIMDAGPLNLVILSAVVAAVFFYVLYLVIRTAVRDGILSADERRAADMRDPEPQ
ncbi:hypothetical protein ACU18_03970 [Arthrobacter sp. ZBG10]|uniref:hypothetical protein n=1 Tax=Micrococcaceae TaxID=1268 RepID=UPI00067FE4F6|nr:MULTISPECIES: hypothetical protein [Micrococcaceae]KNH20732.1 hypothetical protein ACU18_03970 [Arthrobacter sp. ZBG10]KQQ92147.1 hypothetical protein ASF72_02815 [Arthrobacter sp. Leaf141]